VSAPVVFFELGGTLGAAWSDPDGDRLAAFAPYLGVNRLLESLAPRARLGLLELDPSVDRERIDRALARSRLDRHLDRSLVLQRNPREADPFGRALDAADIDDPELATFVSRDATRRLAAGRRGLRVAPHPFLAAAAAAGEPLYYARLEIGTGSGHSWLSVLEGLSIAPLQTIWRPDAGLYAVAAESALGALADRGVLLERMGRPEDVAGGDLFVFRSPLLADPSEPTMLDFESSLRGELSFVHGTAGGIVVALPGDRSIDEFHPPNGGHGHTAAMTPSVVSLWSGPVVGALSSRALTSQEQTALASLDAGLLEANHDPWIGKATVGAGASPILIQSRHTFHPHNAVAVSALAERLSAICGPAQVRLHEFGFVGHTFSNVEAEIPGTSSELVVIGAHLDSTAALTPGYPGHETTGAAPGADDDASGIAGLLAAAQVLKALADVSPPQRTIRFLLFNAEEQGLQGSPKYSGDLKGTGQGVAAMIQMDMIGWASPPHPPGRFEVHGAGPDDFSSSIHASSQQLSQIVVDAAAQVSPTLQAELHPQAGCDHDPAAGRSDHSAFHTEGWRACLVCEDLFAGSCDAPSQAGNPDYHRQSDLTIDYAYAADVARTVAAAAWMVAKPSAGPTVIADTGGPREGTARDGTIVAPRSGDGEPRTTDEPGSLPGQGDEPMPKKYLVEFLARWIRDEEFRCQVLHKEQTTLEDWELTTPQIMDLLSLDKERIVDRLVKELEGLGIELETVQKEVYGPGPDLDLPLSPPPGPGTPLTPPGGSGSGIFRVAERPGNVDLSGPTGSVLNVFALLAANTAYNEGQVHIRGVTPEAVDSGSETLVVVRGQGFDEDPTIEFRKQDQQDTKVEGEVLGVSCDIDVFQRVTVKVKLGEEGYWLVHGRNAGEEWSTETVVLTVT
jgi:hypothetical protein